ncbi:MAG: response regulator [Desulfobacteraceae bacterium]|nr:response regulator [Desulfobacteraceae bacterium]
MSKKILIIDDDVIYRTLLEHTLEELEDEHGVEILTASDGEKGFALIQKERPQIVFLDIMMPGKNGYEVCRSVREDPNLDNTKVILLTTKGEIVDKVYGMACGAFKYINKPFDPDEIMEEAKKLLGIRK